MRLDIHLTKKYPKYSRSYLQKLIKSGAVLVNKKIKKPHYQLKPSDKITENIIPPEKIDLSPDRTIKLNIVYEDKNYLVINKPAGLVVHPSESVKSKTLVNALLAHYPPIKNIGDKKSTIKNQKSKINPRPGLVHRLDKDASGLMVIAKTESAFNDLKNQFKNHEIKKGYTALVHGNIKNNSGEITLPIARSKKGFKMSAHPQAQKKDKSALTRFKVLKRLTPEGQKVNPRIYSGAYTLLKIQTLTGRTHQIRVHLQALGHPLVGDPIYLPKRLTPEFIRGKKTSAHRLFLHADSLQFSDLQSNLKKFTLPLPPELNKILKKLNDK